MLYSDLHTILVDLISVNNPCMVTLSSPLLPTSTPVVSAIQHLKEVAIIPHFPWFYICSTSDIYHPSTANPYSIGCKIQTDCWTVWCWSPFTTVRNNPNSPESTIACAHCFSNISHLTIPRIQTPFQAFIKP